VPLHLLRGMPLADLQLYQRYTSRRGFPGRRVELLLAQVALVLAQVNGNKDLTLRQFLFDPPPEADDDEQPPDPEQAAEQVAAFFGYAPRKRSGTPQPENNRDTPDGQQPGQPGRIAGP
jgi:hypothetical protein